MKIAVDAMGGDNAPKADLRATFYDCFERYMTNSPENTGSSAT